MIEPDIYNKTNTMKCLKNFDNHADYETVKSGLATPNVSYCLDENEVHYTPIPHDYSLDYFTIVPHESGYFHLFYDDETFGGERPYQEYLEYSLNEGDWIRLDKVEGMYVTTDPIKVKKWDKIRIRGINDSLSYSGWYQYEYRASAGFYLMKDLQEWEHIKFDVEGNIMSLLYGSDFVGKTDLTDVKGDYSEYYDFIFATFASLFYNLKVVHAKNLVLPATTLTKHCYNNMFYNCSYLKSAPELPATTLTEHCYYYMFANCGLLKKAPELPATTLANSCYSYMFRNCTSLNYIACLATNIDEYCCVCNWTSGVSANGTFSINPFMNNWERGSSGIPDGWEIINYILPE